MKGRQLKFILLLCTLAVLAYLAGEILLLFVFDNNNIWVSRGWLIAVFCVRQPFPRIGGGDPIEIIKSITICIFSPHRRG